MEERLTEQELVRREKLKKSISELTCVNFTLYSLTFLKHFKYQEAIPLISLKAIYSPLSSFKEK